MSLNISTHTHQILIFLVGLDLRLSLGLGLSLGSGLELRTGLRLECYLGLGWGVGRNRSFDIASFD